MTGAIDAKMPLAYFCAIIWSEAMAQARPTKLTFAQMLVLNSIKGRIFQGVATTTDRDIGRETALAVETVRDVRRGLQAAKLIDCRIVDEASGEIAIRLLERAAVP